MKNPGLVIIGLFIVLITGCKKNDQQLSTDSEKSVTNDQSTGWAKSNADQNSIALTINDPSITSDIIDKGMVLVYLNSKGGTSILPMQETKDGIDFLWYYAVDDGMVTVFRSGDSSQMPNDIGIQHIVLNQSQLSTLQSKGIDEVRLLELNAKEVSQLLSK